MKVWVKLAAALCFWSALGYALLAEPEPEPPLDNSSITVGVGESYTYNFSLAFDDRDAIPAAHPPVGKCADRDNSTNFSTHWTTLRRCWA